MHYKSSSSIMRSLIFFGCFLILLDRCLPMGSLSTAVSYPDTSTTDDLVMMLIIICLYMTLTRAFILQIRSKAPFNKSFTLFQFYFAFYKRQRFCCLFLGSLSYWFNSCERTRRFDVKKLSF